MIGPVLLDDPYKHHRVRRGDGRATVYRGSAAGFVTRPALSVALADVVE